MKAKEFIPASKPRNFVAKNAMKTTSGAGAHRDKKKEQKQGYEKHKGRVEENANNWLGITDRGGHLNLKLDTDDEEEVRQEFQRQFRNHKFVKFIKNPKPVTGPGYAEVPTTAYPQTRPSPDNPMVRDKSSVPFNECPVCRGPIVHESQILEKQDACYHKVKSRYKVWPSAYASGALVQCRKKGAKNWGNKS